MKKSYYSTFITFLGIIIIYSMVSKAINKEIIAPNLKLIIKYLFSLKLKTITINTYTTLSRTFISFSLSLFIALVLSVIANYKTVANYLNPLISIIKTIPTISVIIIALIWLGRNKSVLLIGFLVIFPILYETFYHTIRNVDKKLVEVCKVYQFSLWKRIKYLYFYAVLESFFVSLKQTFGLTLKIMVMSEVIGQTTRGIGMQIYNEKVNLAMAGVFSWTIILIIIVLVFDRLMETLAKTVLKWR